VLLPSYKALTELLIDFTTYDKQSEIMDYINSLGLSKKFKIVGLVKEGDMTNTALALTLKPVDIISLPLSVSNFERRIKTAFTKEGK
jgi:hypothetical protein